MSIHNDHVPIPLRLYFTARSISNVHKNASDTSESFVGQQGNYCPTYTQGDVDLPRVTSSRPTRPTSSDSMGGLALPGDRPHGYRPTKDSVNCATLAVDERSKP